MRSVEYGVFNDEGLIDSGFYSLPLAEARAARYRAEGDRVAEVSAICEYHDDQAAEHCEECNSEENTE